MLQASGDGTYSYIRNVVEELEGKRQPEISKSKWENNIKMELKCVSCILH
jgi:hypothetical protein